MSISLNGTASKPKRKRKSKAEREMEKDPGATKDALIVRHVREKTFAEMRREKDKKMKIFRKFLHKREKVGTVGGNVIDEFQGVMYQKMKNKNIRREEKINQVRERLEQDRTEIEHNSSGYQVSAMYLGHILAAEVSHKI